MTWPADEVRLRFDADGVSDVALLKGGETVGPPGVRGDSLDSAESSDAEEFAVVLVDKEGNEKERHAARWLRMRYSSDCVVAFGDEPTETDAGLSGDVMAASVAPTGQVEVRRMHVSDS